MPASPEILAYGAVIAFCAYLVFGLCGFGSTLIAVPLLAHFFPLKFVVPVIVIVDCAASLHQGFRLRAGVNRRDMMPLLPFLAAGMVIGAFVLARTPGTVLLPLLGVFVTAYGVRYALKHESVYRLARWSAAPIGLVAGTTSSVFGMGGPFYVMYLAGRGTPPEQIRATMPVIFIVTTLGRIALFALAGLITREVLIAAALLAPVMALGLWSGNRWHARFSRSDVVRAIGAVLALSGLSLLLRSL
jgi:uncharacterized membrane protein YfcA